VTARDECGRETEIREAGLATLLDEPRVLEQTEMTRHARLGDAENTGELRHVQLFGLEQPQQAQARLVAEQPEQRSRIHIYKSTFIDMLCKAAARPRGSISYTRT